ncbi:MAG: phospholipase D family protein [Gammaproteobacteria bacterium]|nr:phospholipase D family protein [Gammaproteobacteria bacterium]MDH3749885.1 phospholipase D family protein [Gammaproteobacteria bacterium]
MTRPCRRKLKREHAVLTYFSLLLLIPGGAGSQSLSAWVGANCEPCATLMVEKTGVYILEKGEEALMGRAWLTQHAEHTIDVQYFIWSTDNIGILAAEMLLNAADRGVTVRVLVDDFLIDAEDKTLVLLAAHPNVHIRIYNPNFSVGTSFFRRIANSVLDFRGTNQRMHDKTAIFDGVAGITGGRNMADEYFDFDHEYNFRDRDVLLLGAAVRDMGSNFDEFWDSPLAVPVEQLLKGLDEQLSKDATQQKFDELHAYARDPANFEPAIRDAIENMPTRFPRLLQAMSWHEVNFISDAPGKNRGDSGLSGGGTSTRELIEALRGARHSVLIQSPYLILPKGGIELFAELHRRGVRVRVSTNSLASTDNVPAFCGYFKQRPRLIKAGLELYEYKPHPHIQAELVERYPRLASMNPVFALHAKSMVIDGTQIFIGTFNLDPRSANLNTEVGVLIDSRELGQQLTQSIERDIRPENSWRTTSSYNPDREVSRSKRLELGFINLFPMDPIL